MPRARTSAWSAALFALALVACAGGDDTAGGDGTLADPTPATATVTVAPTPTDSVAATGADPPPADTTDPPTEVEPAPADPPVPPSEPPAEVSVAPAYDFGAVSSAVAEFVEDRGLNGAGLAIVHREDGVIHEEHWGEFAPDRISLVASSSKMITAGVLLRLQDDGLLDIDQPIAELVDWGAGNPDVTVAQLLSNSSGLVGLLPRPEYGPYVCQFIASGTLQECGAAIFSTAGDDADVIPPDTTFRYGGAQWQVAGAVAEAVSGRSWAELIQEIYVEPCGLESLAFNNHFTQIGTGGFDYPVDFGGDPSTLAATDNPNLEGGAYVTTGDYARLLLMHLRDGMCDDNRVLSAAAVDRMHEDRIARYGADAGIDLGYGMGWWVDRASGRISDGGAYGSVPWLDLEDGYGAFLVIEADAATGQELAADLFDLVEAAVVGA